MTSLLCLFPSKTLNRESIDSSDHNQAGPPTKNILQLVYQDQKASSTVEKMQQINQLERRSKVYIYSMHVIQQPSNGMVWLWRSPFMCRLVRCACWINYSQKNQQVRATNFIIFRRHAVSSASRPSFYGNIHLPINQKVVCVTQSLPTLSSLCYCLLLLRCNSSSKTGLHWSQTCFVGEKRCVGVPCRSTRKVPKFHRTSVVPSWLGSFSLRNEYTSRVCFPFTCPLVNHSNFLSASPYLEAN